MTAHEQDKPGWLKRDQEAARREIDAWPSSMRPFLRHTYRPIADKVDRS